MNEVTTNLAGRKQAIGFAFILLQLGLLLFSFLQFNLIHETQFDKIIPVIFFGFIVHHWIGIKYKLPFFVLLSFIAITSVLGLFNGLVLIGVGALLLITCHLPINFYLKFTLIIITSILLILFRANLIFIKPIPYIIPFIGTMFMLRLIIYIYDIKHDNSTKNIWHRIAYFFLLPNVCFPLFPLIDYKILVSTYFNNSDTIKIYNIGLRRIFRGAIHILTYRIIYYLIVPDPTNINGIYDILQFVIFSYTLILRLSGMYHISLGILNLFGFNLPDIFNNYFFASSFNNIWKRINIYWREALMKVFYYPIYFAIRKITNNYAVAISIPIVFFLNWAMHGYQWFWIRGGFPLEANDFLFWMVFGCAVMLNSLYLQKKRAPKKLNSSIVSTNIKSTFFKVIKPIGMFAFMSSIWLMWSSSSLQEWKYLLSFFTKGTPIEYAYIGFSFLIFVSILILLSLSYQNGILRKILTYYNKQIEGFTFISILALFLVSFPEITSSFSIKGTPFIQFIQENKLSDSDKRTMERGYYQKLLTDNNNSLMLSQFKLKQPKDWYQNNAYEKTNSILRKKLKPNYSTIYKGESLTTNSWGIRDKEYSLEKDSTTYRFAMLGGSYEMGGGVKNNETFESITELNLSNQFSKNIEILNFSSGGYHLVENEYNINNTFQFKPDAVIYTAHSNEISRLENRLLDLLSSKDEFSDPFLKKIKTLSGVKKGMCALEKQHRIKPYINSILKWGYLSIVNKCKKNNVIPIWVYIPALGDSDDSTYDEVLQLANKCGFITIEIKSPYNTFNKDELMIAPWDFHLNKKGHQLIANNLTKELISHKKELKLD